MNANLLKNNIMPPQKIEGVNIKSLARFLNRKLSWIVVLQLITVSLVVLRVSQQ